MPLGLRERLLFQALYRFPGYRRDIVANNLTRALPGLEAEARDALIRTFYRYLATLGDEIAQSSRLDAEHFRQAVTLQNPEQVREATDNFSRSVVFVLLHQGNWEWLLHGASLALGVAIDPLYQPLHNRWLDQRLHQLRSRFGATPVNIAGISRYLLEHRRNPRALAILGDQSPSAGEPALRTEFLGVDTAFKTGFTRIASAMDAAIVFAACEHTAPGRYAVTFQPFGTPPYARSDHDALVVQYAHLAEQAIRAQPYSWLWTHRRWKLTPE